MQSNCSATLEMLEHEGKKRILNEVGVWFFYEKKVSLKKGVIFVTVQSCVAPISKTKWKWVIREFGTHWNGSKRSVVRTAIWLVYQTLSYFRPADTIKLAGFVDF